MKQVFASLSFRLALTYAVLFVGSLLLLVGAYYAVVVRVPLREAEQVVRREAEALANVYIVDGEAALVRQLRARDAAPDRYKAFHAFIDRDGRIVTANLPSWPRAVFNGWGRIEADIPVDGDEHDFEALALDRRFDDGARLIVGRDIDNITERERALASGASFVAAAAVLLALLGGLLMSRAIGRRVDRVATTARSVMAGDMSKRVSVDGSGDEFDRLAETLNAMLHRIEHSMESVRRVSDSVAHEMRTPLARLRASLEDALASDEGDTPRVAEALAEAERLGSIFDTVLRIARLETGSREIEMAPVDLTALLEDVADFYRPETEERSIMLSTFVQAGLVLRCDRDLVFQAVANLLDNAIKYTPGGGEIVLAGQAEKAALLISVHDSGPGIAENDLPHVTERFYRAKDGTGAGIGLGLSLVDTIARLHRSTLAFVNVDGGFRVDWRFPA
nr:HAMP domain-containing sensor histidine kinase [Sphingomonas sp. Y57]